MSQWLPPAEFSRSEQQPVGAERGHVRQPLDQLAQRSAAGAIGATLVGAEEAEREGVPEQGRFSLCSHGTVAVRPLTGTPPFQKYLLDPHSIRSEGGRLALSPGAG